MTNTPGHHQEPPLIATVRVRSRIGPLQLGAAVLVAAVLVAFAAGYRLAGDRTAIAPSPMATLPTIAPTAAAPSPAPIPDLQPAQVSRRLRGAVAVADVVDNSWLLCAVEAAPRCQPIAIGQVELGICSLYSTEVSLQWWSRLPPVSVRAVQLFIVIEGQRFADPDPSLGRACGPGDGPIGLWPIAAAHPSEPGSFHYYDLGTPEPGRYIVTSDALAQADGDDSATNGSSLSAAGIEVTSGD